MRFDLLQYVPYISAVLRDNKTVWKKKLDDAYSCLCPKVYLVNRVYINRYCRCTELLSIVMYQYM